MARFTSNSRHVSGHRGAPLRARSDICLQLRKNAGVELLDQLVGEQLQRVGHLKAERLCRLPVDDELEFGRLQDR